MSYAEMEAQRLITQISQMRGTPVPEVEEAREVIEASFRKKRKRRVTPPIVTQAAIIPPVQALLPTMEGLTTSLQEVWSDLMRGLDPWIPEEIIGLDITPQARVGRETKGRVFYDDVWVEDGKIKVIRRGNLRILGYTPQHAKKKFRTKRRRKRLTKRDMYILEVLKENPQAGALALML